LEEPELPKQPALIILAIRINTSPDTRSALVFILVVGPGVYFKKSFFPALKKQEIPVLTPEPGIIIDYIPR
jgi:hypothetical protein